MDDIHLHKIVHPKYNIAVGFFIEYILKMIRIILIHFKHFDVRYKSINLNLWCNNYQS